MRNITFARRQSAGPWPGRSPEMHRPLLGKPWRRPRIGLDVAFFLGNDLLWGSVAIWVLEPLSLALGGWVPSTAQALFASQPWWLQALEVIALSDLGIYGFHRACHSWEPLRRIHRVHHSAEQFDWGGRASGTSARRAAPLGFSVQVVGTFFIVGGQAIEARLKRHAPFAGGQRGEAEAALQLRDAADPDRVRLLLIEPVDHLGVR